MSAGDGHTVLLRSDGQAVAFGSNSYGQTDVPDLTAGLHFTAAAAGTNHTVLLRSDGQAVAFGLNGNGHTDVPNLPAGLEYTLEPELHVLWMRVAWVVRKTGCEQLSKLPPVVLRNAVFRFFLRAQAN